MNPFIERGLLRVWRLLPRSPQLRRTLLWRINSKFMVGVMGMILNERGEVLLAKHTYRSEYPWSLPGGWLKQGEKPEDALPRELEEETGYKIRVIKLLALETDPDWLALDAIYLCAIEGGTFRPSEEVSEAAFFSMDNLPPLGEKTVSVLRRLKPQA